MALATEKMIHRAQVTLMKKLIIRPTPPFRLDLTVWALRRLPINLIDRWENNVYRRVLVFDSTPIEVSVVQTGSVASPELSVSIEGSGVKKHVSRALGILEKMLGLAIDLSEFYRLAEEDKKLLMLTQRFTGLKPPSFPTVFEAVVNGIACQQLSLNVGIHLLSRLSAAYGLRRGSSHAFPRPIDLSEARPEDLRELGFSNRKARNILEIARWTLAGQVDDNVFQGLDDSSVAARLQGLPGVGRWTAQYVSLRGLRRLNVFPADDVGGQNKLRNWLSLTSRPNYDSMNRILDRWGPFKGLIYFYLLLDHLAQKGYVEP